MKPILSAIYPFAFAALIFILPFDVYVRAWPNILLAILAISFPFIVCKEDFKKIDRKGALLFLGFYLFIVLQTLLLGRWENNLFFIEKVGIGMGLALLFIPIKDYKKLNNAIIFSSLIAILYSVFNILILIKNTGTFDFGNNGNPLSTLLIDRLYLGVLSIFSILISYKNITKKFSTYNKWYLVNIIINALFIFLIAARMAMLTIIFLAILRLFYKLPNRGVVIKTLVGLTIVIIAAFSLNENLRTRFFYNTPDNENLSFVEKALQVEPRVVIWECSNEIAKNNPAVLSGLGFKGTKEALMDCYKTADIEEERRGWFLFREYNSHNQYIDIYLSAGIIALLLFIISLGYLIYTQKKHFFPTAMVITIVLFGLIENYFHRQIGAYYFGVVLIYILLANSNSHKISEK